MIQHLEIVDIVLVERLVLSFGSGLTVMTGETGAGKSILLDALGLVLGARADSGLVRQGQDYGMVTAEFSIDSEHPCQGWLMEQGLEQTGHDGTLLLRRRVQADGGSRAWINDSPVSVNFLKKVGNSLIEIQGQFDTFGLLNPATQQSQLDHFGGLCELAKDVMLGWKNWRKATETRKTAEEDLMRGESEREELMHNVDALKMLNPQAGEAQELEAERSRLVNLSGLQQALDTALAEINGSNGAESCVSRAERALNKLSDASFTSALEALERCSAELSELGYLLSGLRRDLPEDESGLEATDNRLHDLRAAARKHGVSVEELSEFKSSLQQKLEALSSCGDTLAHLQQEEQEARSAYLALAGELAKKRRVSSIALEAAMHEELPDLKLETATFISSCSSCDETKWGPSGTDQIQFLLSANPGIEPVLLHKAASGGELARITLALKVALTRSHNISVEIPTLIFDEVDSGVGGATADAVGRRLARLAAQSQILVVTHSPQVAARGQAHYRVRKTVEPDGTRSHVESLDPQQRREEIARMLSGEVITQEARAAARSLLESPDCASS